MPSERTVREVEKLNSLHQIALVLTKITDLNRVLQEIASAAIRTLGADCITVYRYSPQKSEFETPPLMVGLIREREAMQTPLKAKVVPVRVLQKRQAHFAYVAENDPIMSGPFVAREKIKSSAGLPLIVKDKIVGVLFINYRTRHGFPKDERKLLTTFAAYAAIAIENSGLYEQTSVKLARRLAELEKLASIDRAMISDIDFDAVLNLIIDKAIELVGPASGRIRLVDETGKMLMPKVVRGVLQNQEPDLAIRAVGECIVGRVAETGRAENVGNVARDKDFKRFMESIRRKAKRDNRYASYYRARKNNVGSEIAIPLKIQHKVIGVLNVYRSGINAFSDDDMKWLSILTDRAAGVVYHAKLHRDLQKEAGMLRAMPEIAKQMTSDLSLNEVLSDIAEGITRISPGSIPNIFLYDERTREYKFEACARTGEETDLGHFPIRRHGVGWRVIRKVRAGRSDDFEIIEDVTRDPRASRTARGKGVQSTACFPLKFRGHVLGLLYLHYKKKHEFSQEEKALLAKFADQAAIAIKNAMHFENLSSFREELFLAINKAWAESVWIYSPKIEFGDNLHARKLVSRIELPEGETASPREIEGLLAALFQDDQKITVFDLPSGFSGAPVVKVHPVDRSGFPKNEVIVKFGWKDVIDQEIRNFRDHVDGKLGGYRSTVIKGSAFGSTLGAVAYSFIGTPTGGIHELEEYYKARFPNEVPRMVHNLFCETCGKWYQKTAGPVQRDLSTLYEEELSLDRGKLNDSFVKYFPEWARKKFMRFPGVQGRFINPVRWLSGLSAPERSKIFAFPNVCLCITHGDLRNGNIFVDQQGSTWLIDFFSTKESHLLRDFAKFEATVKFELLPATNLTKLCEFEEALLAHDRFSDFLKSQDPEFSRSQDELKKAYLTIKRIREIANDTCQTDSMRQYFVSLFFYTLHLCRSRILSRLAKKKHALMSASLICGRLRSD